MLFFESTTKNISEIVCISHEFLLLVANVRLYPKYDVRARRRVILKRHRRMIFVPIPSTVVTILDQGGIVSARVSF